MKTLKSVVAILAALLLSIPLSGCFEEESKTASQSSDVGSSIFQSKKEGVPDSNGITTFLFSKGINAIGVTYASTEKANKSLPLLKETLAAAGIKVTSLSRSGSDMSIGVDVLKKDVIIEVDTTDITLLRPYKKSGPAFQWVAIEGFV